MDRKRYLWGWMDGLETGHAEVYFLSTKKHTRCEALYMAHIESTPNETTDFVFYSTLTQ